MVGIRIDQVDIKLSQNRRCRMINFKAAQVSGDQVKRIEAVIANAAFTVLNQRSEKFAPLSSGFNFVQKQVKKSA